MTRYVAMTGQSAGNVFISLSERELKRRLNPTAISVPASRWSCCSSRRSGAVKAIAEKAPGPIALTPAEPQSVDDVAAATAAAALGKCDGASVDGADDIKACAAKLA